ncbi:MAG: hypothetical protein QM756_06430 [Polyangiaceae bacterium]
MSKRSACVPLCLAWVLVGCGNPDSSAPGPISDRTQANSDRYLPLAVGAVWTYWDVDKMTGQTGNTRSEIERLENVGGSDNGTMAYRVKSTTLDGSTINWQLDENNSITRLREQFFDASGAIVSDYDFMPHKVRLDESAIHTQVGAAWPETYTANAILFASSKNQSIMYSVSWAIEAVDETVTVPAGTFKCLRVRRLEPGGIEPDRTYWFARHVGKVKEDGTVTKELTGYKIPSTP